MRAGARENLDLVASQAKAKGILVSGSVEEGLRKFRFSAARARENLDLVASQAKAEGNSDLVPLWREA